MCPNPKNLSVIVKNKLVEQQINFNLKAVVLNIQ